MNSALLSIDITNIPELKRLAKEMNKAGKPFALREHNHTVAVLTPVDTPSPFVKNDKKEFLAGAGKLKGVIDADRIIANIYHARAEGSRPSTRP